MANDWRPSNWGDEVTLEYGKAIRGYSQTHGKYRVFGSNGPIGWTNDALTQGPGVVLGRKGAYRGVEFCREPFWVIDTAYYVVPKTDLDMRWLYYAVKHYKLGEVDDGSPIPSTTRAAVYMLELDVPPKHEQKAISRILGTLDDKIELNRKENETLEAMALTLFKAWFVDFEPVRAKIEGRWQRGQSLPGLPAHLYDLFPDRLVESELGEVPEGWQFVPAGEIYAVGIGKTPPRKEQHWFTESVNDVPWVSIKDMGSSGLFISETSERLTSEAVEKYNIRLVPTETVLLSFKLTVGRLAITDCEMTTNEAIAHFKSKKDSPSPTFLWCYLRQFDFAQLGSTSSIATATNSKAIREMPILRPSKELLVKFNEASSPLFQEIRSLQRQSRSLAQLRDTLLPKLILGQLKLPQTILSQPSNYALLGD